MFITLTRIGGSSSLRVAAAAVAHITSMADGAVVHLVSGEHLRVGEPAAEVESAVVTALAPDHSAIAKLHDEVRVQGAAWHALLEQRSATVRASDAKPVDEPTAPAAELPAEGEPAAVGPPAPQRRRGRGRRS